MPERGRHRGEGRVQRRSLRPDLYDVAFVLGAAVTAWLLLYAATTWVGGLW